MQKLAYTRTFGCRQNEADTERLRGALAARGYALTDDLAAADLALINTCAVREHAESKAFGHIGALKHWKNARKGRVLVVCGCMAEQDEIKRRIKLSYPHVDIVFGTKAPEDFQIPAGDALRGPPPKAGVPIMSGCDNFCAYCVVPYVRGRETSRDGAEIESEVAGLIKRGYKDITLLGQNVNSYRGGEGFTGLLKRLCAIDGDFWLRFMTSHPKDCSEDLIELMAAEPRMARHLHLPVQSGSDRILREMNRGYTAARHMSLTRRAKELMPDITLTSDVMVGFPGETEDDFAQTLELVEQTRFDSLFTFIYSPRRGTPAAELEQLPDEVKRRRFERLIELQNAISNSRHAALTGSVQRVLTDGYDSLNERPLSGRNSGGRLVRLTGPPELAGTFVEAEITGHNSWNLFGRVLT